MSSSRFRVRAPMIGAVTRVTQRPRQRQLRRRRAGLPGNSLRHLRDDEAPLGQRTVGHGDVLARPGRIADPFSEAVPSSPGGLSRSSGTRPSRVPAISPARLPARRLSSSVTAQARDDGRRHLSSRNEKAPAPPRWHRGSSSSTSSWSIDRPLSCQAPLERAARGARCATRETARSPWVLFVGSWRVASLLIE